MLDVSMDHIKIKNDNNLLADIADSLERHSMQCRRCGDLAAPLHQKGHLYKCLSCEKIYDGVNYNFTRLKPICSNEAAPVEAPQFYDNKVQAECFNEAINLLREKTHQQKATEPLYSKLIKHIFTKKRH